MHIDSVRELKQQAIATLADGAQRRVVAAGVAQGGQPRRFMSLGIAPRWDDKGYSLAIRLQREDGETLAAIEKLKNLARGEVDIRYIDRVKAAAISSRFSIQHRPLQIGCAIGHYRVQCGTLGAFVRRRDAPDGAAYLLSNNHILANENRSKPGDDILQPGPADGGKSNRDRVAGLAQSIQLVSRPNVVDCAVAEIDAAIGFDPRYIPDIGKFSGAIALNVETDLLVVKRGAVSGVTHGRVTAFEVNDLVVGYRIGNLLFNEQIEIEGVNSRSFSKQGDSGSLVLDMDQQAVGLVFARSEKGGSNGLGLTYANPIKRVIDALNVDLI